MPLNSNSVSTSTSGTSTSSNSFRSPASASRSAEQRTKPPDDVGVFGRVVRDLRDRHFVHPLLVLAGADQFG